MSWRRKEVLNEAIANLGLRQLAIGVTCAFLMTALGVLTGLQASDAIEQMWARQVAGDSVWIATAGADETLHSGSCEALNRNLGVEASGGVTVTPPTQLRRFERSRELPVVGVTPHLLGVWNGLAPTSGIIVGEDLEKVGQVGVGSLVTDGSETTVVSARTPVGVQGDQLLSSLLVTVPADAPLKQCMIRMQRGSEDLGGELLLFTYPEATTTVVPYLSDARGLLSPREQWHQYADLQPWFASGVLTGLVLALSSWFSRSQTAIYRTFGTSRLTASLMSAIQAFLVLLPATLLATAASLLITAAHVGGALGSEVTALIAKCLLSAALLAMAIEVIAAAFLVRGNLLVQLKDR